MLRDQLIGDLYEAALHHDSFLDVFQQVITAFGADYFHMFSWDVARNAPQFSTYTAGLPDTQIALYDQYYGALDPRRSVVEAAGVGELVSCQDFLSDEDVARSEFFQDYQIPIGVRYLIESLVVIVLLM